MTLSIRTCTFGWLLSACLLWQQAQAQQSAVTPLSILSMLEADSQLAGASWGLRVQRAGDSLALIEHQGGHSLTPASVTKLFSTATALEVLGPDYRIETQLLADGPIEQGVLKGNLILRGGGDPTLDEARLQAIPWDSLGIRSIQGDVLLDDRLFEGPAIPDGWNWGDIGNYYGAAPNALSFNQNMYRAVFSTGALGTPARLLRLDPALPGFQLENQVAAGPPKEGDRSVIYTAPMSQKGVIMGSIPSDRSEYAVKGALPDPAGMAGLSLMRSLVSKGVQVSGTLRRWRQGSEQEVAPPSVVHTLYSAPLSKLVADTNQESLNLHAETLLNLVGLRQKGKASTQAGLEALKEFWTSKGMDMRGFFLDDGSGLSRSNAFTARQQVFLLDYMRHRSANAPVFFSSLAVAGRAGTFKNICDGELAEGRFYGKSGTLRRVRSYTGYLQQRNGQWLMLSLMVNNYEGSYNNLTLLIERLLNGLVVMDTGR